MTNRLACVAASPLLLLLAGCATIVHGTTQEVGISSSPSQARVRVNGQELGRTPLIANLKRKDQHFITLELDGYKPHETLLTKKVSGWVLGSVVLGGPIGIAVDGMTGGLYNLSPEQIHAEMTMAGPGESSLSTDRMMVPEEGDREIGWWGGLALGGTGEHLSTLLMGGIRKGHRLLSMRWNGHMDGAFIFAGLADTNYVSELGVLYGFQTEYRWLDFAISGGPSLVSKTTYPGTFSDTRKRTRSSAGMTLGAEATVALGRSFAMGVQGFGGLSSLETLWGVGWVLKFGRLRWE